MYPAEKRNFTITKTLKGNLKKKKNIVEFVILKLFKVIHCYLKSFII